MLRLLVVTVVMGALAALLVATIVSGLRSGKVAHTDSASFCDRRKNPIGYWALLALFSGFAYLALSAWFQVARQVFFRSPP
jgi:hypothetical protein